MRAVVIHGAGDLRVEDIPETELGAESVAVNVEAGGICGSDLHYYVHGGFGAIRLKQPLVLGHEIAGTVAAVGSAVRDVRPGMRVAVDPSRPCHECEYCRRAEYRHCLDMIFLGSALRFPHVGGGFRETLVVSSRQAIPLADHVPFSVAAMAEPLAVCLHAGRRAGLALGQKVLITGCGPIGVLCIVVARLAGAREIVAVDIDENALRWAREAGADDAIHANESPDALAAHSHGKGTFDVALEASGSEQAIVSAIEVLRPGGVLLQVGLGGTVGIPLSTLVGKEIALRGTFRFDAEFRDAVDLINRRAVTLDPFITATMPISKAREAFDLATNRSSAMKVQLSFGGDTV